MLHQRDFLQYSIYVEFKHRQNLSVSNQKNKNKYLSGMDVNCQ